ncbi:copper ion binding protein [Planomicrobium sp. YIM 101495]|uniref:copper ion binding protein n=1 Tax=Planomicrobium sp. YIM 101495 TaxID=2665160 RepID=UPI0012B8893E|nr:copper ion binding protein [Planomicrobium sp. YIM 101495]MTD31573.1 copper ion binding protein [Planomicrobium sp. YIM 101495]
MTKQIQLQVSGMSCQSCVKSVTESAMALDGVENVDVSLEGGSVEIAFDESKTDMGSIAEAIEEQGYEVGMFQE